MSVASYVKKPTIKPDEVSMKMTASVPDEMFVKPTLECRIELPTPNVHTISVNKKAIEKAISHVTGCKIEMTVNELVV